MTDVVKLAVDDWLKQTLKLGDAKVVVPHLLARSAVFSSMPVHTGRRVYTRATQLAAWSTVTIEQVLGHHLTQADETIWLLLVRRALRSHKSVPPGCNKLPIDFTTAELLRELKQPNDSKHRNSIRESITYLGRARYRIGTEKMTYEGSMLDIAAGTSKGDTTFHVWLDVAISSVFLAGWSYLNVEHRNALRHNPLAQWLLTHYSTHKSPWPISSAKLQQLADRSTMREDKFRASLGIALDELSSVTGWKCAIDTRGLVSVDKHPKSAESTAKPLEVDTVTDTRLTTLGIACASDELLLDAWLLHMNKQTLIKHLTYQEALPANLLLFGAPDLRNLLRDVLRGRPAVLDARLKKLRAKEQT